MIRQVAAEEEAMIMRRRPLLRAAAVGGGAYAVGRHAARKSMAQDQAESEQNERLANLEQQSAPPPAPAAAAPAAGAAAGSIPSQLDQLAELHERGVLSDDEFTAAKAKLLGGDPLDRGSAG
jgi:hypothetical protein